MQTRFASFARFAPWIGAAALLFAVACTGGVAGDELVDGSAPPSSTPDRDLPGDPNPAPDSPVTATPIVEPGPAGAPPSDAARPLPPPIEVVEALAPIVAIELLIAESFPPQYFVAVTSAQPSGCHRFSRFEVTRNGAEIEVAVWNTVPKDLAVVLCTAIYGTTESSIPLGSDFEPGVTYTLSVNGERQTFVAQ